MGNSPTALAMRVVLTTGCALAGGGCLAEKTPAPESRLAPLARFSVTVADFSVPLMTDACFTVTAFDTDDPALFDAAHTVWSAPGLCASQHGGPGAMLAVAAHCDPDAPGPEHVNAVRLVLDDLYMGGEAGAEGVVLSPDFYANPCPAGADECVLLAPCDESASAAVDFDLVVTAFADLGIYDTRVTLGDIFCSARLDCVDHGGGTLDYLHDPETGRDGPTAVLAFACAGGPDAAATVLLLDDLVIRCDNGWQATVDPAGAPGHASPDDPHGILFAADVNRGDASRGTSFWNVLLGLDLANLAGAGTCTLTTQGSASTTTSCQTPGPARYPVIRWEVDLSEADQRVCVRHVLNDSDIAISTFYTSLATAATFAHLMQHDTGGRVAPCPP